MPKISKKDKELRSLLRQQETQLRRIEKLMNEMEEEGYIWRADAQKGLSTSSATVAQAKKKLAKLKSYNKTKLASRAKGYMRYSPEKGGYIHIQGRGKELAKVVRARKISEAKRRGKENGPVPISIFDQVDSLMGEYLAGMVILHPEVHNNQSELYGKTPVLDTNEGQGVDDAWTNWAQRLQMTINEAWQEARTRWAREIYGEESRKGVEKALATIHATLTGIPSFDSMSAEVFNRTNEIIYHELTGAPLPGELSLDNIDTTDTPYENYR